MKHISLVYLAEHAKFRLGNLRHECLKAGLGDSKAHFLTRLQKLLSKLLKSALGLEARDMLRRQIDKVVQIKNDQKVPLIHYL